MLSPAVLASALQLAGGTASAQPARARPLATWAPQCAAPAGLQRRCARRRAPPLTRASSEAAPPASATFDHVLLAVVDHNAYLSAGTKAACAAAVAHAKASHGKLTLLVADGVPLPAGVDAGVRLDTLRWHLDAAGWPAAQEAPLVQRVGENPAAAISDVADEAGAGLVVLAAAAVHSKEVDCNLLAEFLPCPLLLVPM